MSQRKVKCQCGCGREVYPNQLTEVKVEIAKDQTLRETTNKRWIVTRGCAQAFESELELLEVLKAIVLRWRPRQKTFWQRANFLRTLDLWWMRIGAARNVMRLNHEIYVRTKGFEWARRNAIQSALLFGAPRFLQEFLAGQFIAQFKRRKARDAARPPATPRPLEA